MTHRDETYFKEHLDLLNRLREAVVRLKRRKDDLEQENKRLKEQTEEDERLKEEAFGESDMPEATDHPSGSFSPSHQIQAREALSQQAARIQQLEEQLDLARIQLSGIDDLKSQLIQARLEIDQLRKNSSGSVETKPAIPISDHSDQMQPFAQTLFEAVSKSDRDQLRRKLDELVDCIDRHLEKQKII